MPSRLARAMRHSSMTDMKSRNESMISVKSSTKSSVVQGFDAKLERIHQYNIDARTVLEDNKKQYHNHVRNRLDPLMERDQHLMSYVPKDLCGKKV